MIAGLAVDQRVIWLFGGVGGELPSWVVASGAESSASAIRC